MFVVMRNGKYHGPKKGWNVKLCKCCCMLREEVRKVFTKNVHVWVVRNAERRFSYPSIFLSFCVILSQMKKY